MHHFAYLSTIFNECIGFLTHQSNLSKNKSRNCSMKATKSSPSYESSSCCKIRLVHNSWGSSIVSHLPQWPVLHQKAIAPGKLVERPRCVISPQISNENLYHEAQIENTKPDKKYTYIHAFFHVIPSNLPSP